MDNLTDYLEKSGPPGRMGVKGVETDWMEFTTLPVTSGKILVVDPGFAPEINDGVLVELPPGTYVLKAKAMQFGKERRPSRLRVALEGTKSSIGGVIGEAWADTARIGVCDPEVFEAEWKNDDWAYEQLDRVFSQTFTGVAVLADGTDAILPYVESGFGDGDFPVHELIEEGTGRRVGVEVEIIAPGATYPWEVQSQPDSSGKPSGGWLQRLFGLRAR